MQPPWCVAARVCRLPLTASLLLQAAPSSAAAKSSAPPRLPKHPSFSIRQGIIHATQDFVRALCDASSGLVDVFPMADRQVALRQVGTQLGWPLRTDPAARSGFFWGLPAEPLLACALLCRRPSLCSPTAQRLVEGLPVAASPCPLTPCVAPSRSRSLN